MHTLNVTTLLDEVWRLRVVAALAARRIDGDVALKSYPASRRDSAERLRDMLVLAARGDADAAYMQIRYPRRVLPAVGDRDLTPAGWLESHPDDLDQDDDSFVAAEPWERESLLDEIHALSTVLAYEVERTEADLALNRFPKSRRWRAEGAAADLRRAATGALPFSDFMMPWAEERSEQEALAAVGARPLLTRSDWRQQYEAKEAAWQRNTTA